MSVIAFDGKIVAADKQSSYGDLKLITTKLFKYNDEILSFVGATDEGRKLIEWYKNKEELKFPEFKEYKTTLLIFNKKGYFFYEENDIIQTLENKFIAFGSGRNFALAAMEMGADAKQAVEIACKYDVNCGIGVDVIEV